MNKLYLNAAVIFFLSCCIFEQGSADDKQQVDKRIDSHAIDQSPNKSSAGIGLQGLADWSSQYPFLDQMKLSREWFDWERGSSEGIQLDKHGWVVSLSKGFRAETVFLTTDKSRPVVYKHYIVRWKGKGRLRYGGCAKKVGRAHGGDRVSVRHEECFLSIDSVDKKDPLRDIVIVPEKHIAAFDRGEIFNPDFIERVKVFRAMRFMDWMFTNGSTQGDWSQRPVPEDRSYAQKGVPLELMLLLANKLKADPWFNMPHLSDENYIRNFAAMVNEKLNDQLNVVVEHSNEVWNWIFPQAHYAVKSAKELFNAEGDAYMQWHGMRTAQICDIWKSEVFSGDDKNRVMCVLGVQAGWPGAEIAALECPLWVDQGNRPCFEHNLDAVTIAAYFSGCLNGADDTALQRKIIDWAKAGEVGLAKAYEQVLDARHFECEYSLPAVKKLYEYHVKEAKKRGLKVVAYEGGQHITSNFSQTQKDKDFIGLHTSINRSDYMKKLYRVNFKNWKESGGELFMHFVDTSAYTQYGSWGALEYITQPTSPKWEALMEFNQQPCWWENCK